MKQEEQNKPSLQEEVTSLKRQLAGAKGRNKQLAEENKNLKVKLKDFLKSNEVKVRKLNETITSANEQISNYKSELHTTKVKLSGYKGVIEWYNELPWWKKMFVWKLF